MSMLMLGQTQAAPEIGADGPSVGEAAGTASGGHSDIATLLDGFREALLVDRRTGLARPFDAPSGSLVEDRAKALEPVLRAIEMMVAEMGLEDAAKDIVVTTRGEFQVIRFLDADPATFLFARLGRDGVALPEARLRVKDLELALDAERGVDTPS